MSAYDPPEPSDETYPDWYESSTAPDPDTPKPEKPSDARYVTPGVGQWATGGNTPDATLAWRPVGSAFRPTASPDPTPPDPESQAAERFRLYRLCPCQECGGTGKVDPQVDPVRGRTWARCKSCRGEGRALDLVATCATPEAVGVALITLGREGEWSECPVGVLDTMGETNQKWIVTPWLPSARNVSDAGRTLARSKNTTHPR